MSESRQEWKVGLFVALGLVLVAALMVQFSKREAFFTPTYEIALQSRNVSGLKKGASVLLLGVNIGSVRTLELTPGARDVVVYLRILKQYQIHSDARFVIEQAGFLGDLYISVVPNSNEGPLLHNHSVARCEEPFDLQEAARTGASLLRRIDLTVRKINDTFERLDRTVLSETNLNGLSVSMGNLQLLSEHALRAADSLSSILDTNSPTISAGASNLLSFSERLNSVAAEAQEAIATNRPVLRRIVKNVDSASGVMNDLIRDLQAGKGLAGSLLENEQLQIHMNQTMSNLTMLSSNLARFGILYKPKAAKDAAAEPGTGSAHHPSR